MNVEGSSIFAVSSIFALAVIDHNTKSKVITS